MYDAAQQAGERRGSARISVENCRLLIKDLMLEFKVNDISYAGLGVQRMNWDFAEGEEFNVTLYETGYEHRKEAAVTVARVSPSTVGFRFAEPVAM